MTESELALTLGLVVEPEKNRVKMDEDLMSHIIQELIQSFGALVPQKASIGAFNPDLWAELVPWHSYN